MPSKDNPTVFSPFSNINLTDNIKYL
jgi:serine/threonine protein kinase